MDARVKTGLVESERAAQSGRAGVIEEVLGPGSAALPRPVGRRAHELFAPSAGVARIEPRKREREGPTDGRPRGATTSAPAAAPALGQPRPRCALLTARRLLLLFHLKLTIGAFARFRGRQGSAQAASSTSLPWRSSSVEASGNGRSHCTGRGRMRCPRWSQVSQPTPRVGDLIALALRPEHWPQTPKPTTSRKSPQVQACQCLARGPTLLLEQPSRLRTASAKCHSFRSGLQYQGRRSAVPFGSSWRSA